MIQTETQESSSFVHQNKEKLIEIGDQDSAQSATFLVDGVNDGEERKIRRWRVENGTEVGAPMNLGRKEAPRTRGDCGCVN